MNDNLLEKLWACAAACEYCADQCLGEDNVEMMERCISLDRDCADMCVLTARFAARESEFIKKMLQECMNLCNACAEECGKHEHEHCKRCAEACRQCEEACRQAA
jgi:hypothetical protein